MGICIEFDQKVCEAIRYYVYALRDPQTRSIFYVGKGVGNRCFKHIKAARDNVPDTEKLKTIRKLLDTGIGVDIDIVRHSLNEATALEVEAALIDVLELVCDGNNEVAGHGVKRGLKVLSTHCALSLLLHMDGQACLRLKKARTTDQTANSRNPYCLLLGCSQHRLAPCRTKY